MNDFPFPQCNNYGLKCLHPGMMMSVFLSDNHSLQLNLKLNHFIKAWSRELRTSHWAERSLSNPKLTDKQTQECLREILNVNIQYLHPASSYRFCSQCGAVGAWSWHIPTWWLPPHQQRCQFLERKKRDIQITSLWWTWKNCSIEQ